MSEEFIQMIDTEIQKIIDKDGVFDEAFPPNQYLLRLRNAWVTKDYDEIAKIANEGYMEVVGTISPTTTKAIEKNILASQQWISSFANALNATNPIIKYADPIERERYGKELSEMFHECTKAQLSELTAQLLIDIEIAGARHSLTLNEVSHLRSLFIQSQEKRIQKGQRTSASIKERFADNDASLNEIWIVALKNAKEKDQEIPTYIQFKRLINALKSKPKYIRKPKLTPEEKQLPAEDLAYVMKQKTREDWSETTLRDFYKAKTGKDATTKK